MVRTRAIIGGTVLALSVVLAPGAAAAATPGPPGDTPGGGPGGCRANGQAISGAASAPGAFGEIVRTAAPIADENAEFFQAFCAD